MTQMERYTGKENQIITSNEKIILLHGSKSGIEGMIAPNSREKCDFGKGFYMGTEQTQPFNEEQREKLKYESEINRSRGIELAESICRKYRREGRFFDEILEAGGQYA